MRPPFLVRLDNVTLRPGGVLLFAGLSLEVRAGEHLAVLGPNGAGKSSLLRLMAGEMRPDQGDPGAVTWGFTGRESSSALRARRHARLVSPRQQRDWVRRAWRMSGEEILLSGLENEFLVFAPPGREERRAAAALAQAAGAGPLLARPAPALSQGQLRLLLILRALLPRPELLLLDEPLEGLDGAARQAVLEALLLAADRGCSLVLTAHRPGDLPPLAARVFRLPPRAASPPSGAKRPGPAAFPASRGPARPAARRREAEGISGDAPVLELLDVDVYIDRARVLAGITWTVRRGEHWLVTGPNGSGKSTLLRLLCGEAAAAWKEGTGGLVRWFGAPRPDLAGLRRLVGYASDRLQDACDLGGSAEEIIIAGLRGGIGLHGGPPTEEEKAEAGLWMERLDLLSMRDVPFERLSDGWARRFLLARALAGSPPVMLLDEPCAGLDAASREKFLDALALLAAGGTHIIHVSHHPGDLPSLFSHELRLENGRVAGAGRRKS
ncbi:MAG: ATP-binding cassette domain-containing protein [Desulfovibrio sp.]|jgi:molybdate transport system ATP-binding protein|nr:ATP-binding cassette domain-containing protein [Desulfovibrio sp.]